MKSTLALDHAEQALRQAQGWLPPLFSQLSGATNALGLAGYGPESKAIAKDVVLVAQLMLRVENGLDIVHQCMADIREANAALAGPDGDDNEDGEGVTVVRYADGSLVCGPCHHGNHGACLRKVNTGTSTYDCECAGHETED